MNQDAISERLKPEAGTPAANVFQRHILYALNVIGKHIYAGTVPEHVVAKRRRQNKVARAQRRVNRRRGA